MDGHAALAAPHDTTPNGTPMSSSLRLRTIRRVAACLAFAIVAATTVTPWLTPAAGASTAATLTGLPAPTSARAVARSAAVDVTWTSTTDAHRWKVLAFANDRYVGQRTFAGTARQGRIEHLPPGTSITTWVLALSPDGWWGTWVTTAPVTLPRDASCPATAGTCAHVNARAIAGPATGSGLGVLHGVTSQTDPARIAALSPRHWRISALNADSFRLARATGASITVILSDPWLWGATQPDGRVATPWADFDLYRWWVTVIAGWHQAMGLLPDHWEIQNEAESMFVDPASPVTSTLLVEQHAIAAEAIRSVLPDAEVVGPAVSPFQLGYGASDIEAFTANAAARGVGLGGLTWHENVGYCASCDGGPAAVRQHIDDARAALGAAGLGGLPIDITEYAAPYEQLQPGAIVGYLSALAGGRVRYGGPSCWDRPSATGELSTSCFATPGTLDGLLLPDGTTPTDAWWTYRAYARLAATGANLAATTVDDPTTSAVASVSGTTAVRMLIGRHVGCTAADGACPAGTPSASSKTTTVRMTAPATGTWNIVVSRIASTAGAAGAPVVVKRVTIKAGTTAFTVGAFSLADGQVLQVEATRA
jgi:hypothetical protein